jgi:hypothetical protein
MNRMTILPMARRLGAYAYDAQLVVPAQGGCDIAEPSDAWLM